MSIDCLPVSSAWPKPRAAFFVPPAVRYCSRECQDRAWERIHKLECPILARHKPLQFESNGIDYMQRLTLRLYLLMANSPEIRTQEFVLHNGETRRLDDMECHANELKDSAQFAGILNYFKLYKIDTFDRDLLLRAYGILHVNSFGIDCYTSEDVNSSAQDVSIEHAGTGLYIEGSVFDHSCVANAAASGDGLALEIRALTDIHKGEQIYIDYLQDVLPREERMTILSERYFFRCQCARGCADGLASPFDCTVDYKRYAVLNRLIDSLLIQDEQEHQSSITQEGKDANQKQKKNSDQSKRNEINWSQLYKCWKQRLRLQECYYATARYHPCLSLFYREYLRFLLVNQHRFNNADDDNSETTTTTRTTTTASINQQTVGNEPSSSMNNASQQPPPQIEQDLLEFGQKAKQHLTITHGINHSFYSRLFAPNDESATAAEEPSTSQQAGT